LFVWIRTGTGLYVATLSGAFTSLKTWVSISGSATPNNGFFLRAINDTNNTITLYTLNGVTNPSDNILAGTSLEIRVYP